MTEERAPVVLASRKADTAQAPILDKSGHINLFPAASAKTEKNSEAPERIVYLGPYHLPRRSAFSYGILPRRWRISCLIAENIARVRRDEAQAKAREEEDERIMQQVDAERRIKIHCRRSMIFCRADGYKRISRIRRYYKLETQKHHLQTLATPGTASGGGDVIIDKTSFLLSSNFHTRVS
jgi:hypothetical protein